MELEEKRVAAEEQNRLAAELEEKRVAAEEEKRVAAEEEKRVAESNAVIILNALQNLFTFTPPSSSSPSSSSLSPSSILVRGKFIIKEDNPNSLHFEEIANGNIPEIKNLDECNVSEYVFSFDEEYFMELIGGKPMFYAENTSSQ